jgi:quercetin dioxygenase-like cupin family protein
MDIYRAGTRETRKAPADWFTGTVWQDPVMDAPDPARVRAIKVTFEPGARTNWHTHPLGQTLYILSGVGRVQREGEAIQEVKAGDTVWFAPDEKHWHGAAPTTGMVHLAVLESLDGKNADWLEPVSDADFNATPSG